MAQGHIREVRLKDGTLRFKAIVYLGYGKYTWRTFKGKREAQAYCAKMIDQRNNGSVVLPSKMKFANFCEQWLTDYVQGKSPMTLNSYRNLVEQKFVPLIGSETPLSRITTQHVQGVVSKMQASGLHPSTIRTYFSVLHCLFECAKKWKLVPTNPCADVGLPKVPKTQRTIWDAELINLFWGTSKRSSPFHLLYRMLAYTGVRLGEALALKWSDLNPLAMTITVQRNLVRIPGEFLLKDTKTASSHRELTLPDFLVEELLAAKHQHELIFCDQLGQPLFQSTVRDDFHRVITRAGIQRRCRLHDLRHLCGTLMMEQGINLHLIAKHLGHSEVGTTSRIYLHRNLEMDRQATNAVVKALQRVHHVQPDGSTGGTDAK